MSNQQPLPTRTGVTFVLDGVRHFITAGTSMNRVRVMRTAQDKGATDITTVRNGRIMG